MITMMTTTTIYYYSPKNWINTNFPPPHNFHQFNVFSFKRTFLKYSWKYLIFWLIFYFFFFTDKHELQSRVTPATNATVYTKLKLRQRWKILSDAIVSYSDAKQFLHPKETIKFEGEIIIQNIYILQYKA